MHTLKSIEIVGFRKRSKSIKLQLDRHTNFIIGRNGTGKTTLINLINAILSGDIAQLRFLHFKKATLRFKDETSRRVATLWVEVVNEPQIIESITYFFKPYSNSDVKTFEVFKRQYRRVKLGTMRSPSTFQEEDYSRDYQQQRELQKTLSSLIQTTWLSLHRSERVVEIDDEEFDEESEHISDVDRGLKQAFSRLSSYFYRLDVDVSRHIRDFQKQWFLSFLTSDSRTDANIIHEIDVEKEREALTNIFENFQVDRSHFSKELNTQFTRFEEIRGTMANGPVSGLKRIAILIDTLRLHYLVDQWQDLQNTQKEILKPKNDFSTICTNLLFRKSVDVELNNGICVRDMDGNVIPLEDLSSGEKQLLIFIAEAMLQEKQAHIFLADEPELSLHIEWQESLVRNLLDINPNSQVIFATHSPDIISGYQDHVIRMEEFAQ